MKITGSEGVQDCKKVWEVATEHILCCVNCTLSPSVSDTQTFQLSNLNGALPAHIPAVIYSSGFQPVVLEGVLGVPQLN